MITIFNELTTDDHLTSLEQESKKYTGLYVDMENKPERKYVKEQAELINKLLKKLDRARIDLSKEFRTNVESEFNEIKQRLESANLPFTALIDEHKEKRSKELAEKKAKEQAILDALQKERDHEDALTLDEMMTFKKEQSDREQKERDELIVKQAIEKEEALKIQAEERAEQAEKDKILAQAQAARDAEQAKKDAIEAEKRSEERAEQAAKQATVIELKRQFDEQERIDSEKAKLEANKKHVGMIRREIKEQIMKAGIDEEQAVKVVKILLKLNNVTINY
jgi:hypothetical protein